MLVQRTVVESTRTSRLSWSPTLATERSRKDGARTSAYLSSPNKFLGLLLARAARMPRRLGHFRLLVLLFRIHEISAVVFVVMAHPRHAVLQPVLVAALRRHVEEVIRADQDVEAARIG